jgi:hypothetical protein
VAKPGALSDDAAVVTVEAEVLEWWTAGSPNRGDTPQGSRNLPKGRL